MPASNSENTGSKTKDEELKRDKGAENVVPDESSLLAVDYHHTTSDNNHQAQQQRRQPDSNNTEADIMTEQASSAENQQHAPTEGQPQVLARQHPSSSQDGDSEPAPNRSQNQTPPQEIAMNGHVEMPDHRAETNRANPVVLAGIANVGAPPHVNDDRAHPAPNDINDMDVNRVLERVEGEIAIHEEELEILNRLRELRRRRGAEDYSGFHKRGFGG